MAKEDDEDLRTLLNIWSVAMLMLMVMLKLGFIVLSLKIYTHSAYRDCNIYVELNHKTLVIFHNLKIWFLPYYARTRKTQS